MFKAEIIHNEEIIDYLGNRRPFKTLPSLRKFCKDRIDIYIDDNDLDPIERRNVMAKIYDSDTGEYIDTLTYIEE